MLLCQKPHNTVLHLDDSNTIIFNKTESAEKSVQPKPISGHVAQINDTQVLLSTLIMQVKDSHGQFHKVRILLDNGSQCNFVTRELCAKLGLKREVVDYKISGIGQSSTDAS